MSADHPTAPAQTVKPAKPSKPDPEHPLTAHPAGSWCKKIRGKLHYFGPWADPDGALKKYLDRKDALHAGRKPREATDAITVKELCDAFLNHKQQGNRFGGTRSPIAQAMTVSQETPPGSDRSVSLPHPDQNHQNSGTRKVATTKNHSSMGNPNFQ
jgi:hypothetical protein